MGWDSTYVETAASQETRITRASVWQDNRHNMAVHASHTSLRCRGSLPSASASSTSWHFLETKCSCEVSSDQLFCRVFSGRDDGPLKIQWESSSSAYFCLARAEVASPLSSIPYGVPDWPPVGFSWRLRGPGSGRDAKGLAAARTSSSRKAVPTDCALLSVPQGLLACTEQESSPSQELSRLFATTIGSHGSLPTGATTGERLKGKATPKLGGSRRWSGLLLEST